MEQKVNLTPSQLPEFLLHVAPVRPVFILGQPGIGKSALVQQFADEVGLSCVSLLGTQLAPEDLMGVPQIHEGKTHFCPPDLIARDEPYCLFLDELNGSTPDVQKAFYSLIHDRRIGAYTLHRDSVVISAGNRTQDNAIVRQMSSALINRMIFVELRVSPRDWLDWAYRNEIHPVIIEYIERHPRQLCSEPPKTEEPFSTPRSWHMLSDALKSYGGTPPLPILEVLAYGCLSPDHAGMYLSYLRAREERLNLTAILRGTAHWPKEESKRDLLYYLARQFRDDLAKTLPKDRDSLTAPQRDYLHRAKAVLKDLCEISADLAKLAITESEGVELPDWLFADIVRDLPRLVKQQEADGKAF